MHRILLSALPARSGGKGEATTIAASRQIPDFDCRSDMVIGRLPMIQQAIISGANACCRRFLAALHESRRMQAAIERARYRHLIYDADTGIHFGAYPAAGGSASRTLTSVTGRIPHA